MQLLYKNIIHCSVASIRPYIRYYRLSNFFVKIPRSMTLNVDIWELLRPACILSSLMAAVLCVLGDKTGAIPAVRDNTMLRMLVDNITHGLVGGLTWAAIIATHSITHKQLLEVGTASLLAMSLDIDHFLVAPSWSLQVSPLRRYILSESYPPPCLRRLVIQNIHSFRFTA